MPQITFIDDVTLEAEPAGTGPHYRRGYAPDVSEAEAKKWIKAGKAVPGAVKLENGEALADEPPPVTSKKGRRGRPWRA